MSAHPCPRCFTANPEAARFCRQCGLALVPSPGGFLGAGRVGHPQPLPAPEGFGAIEDTPDLFFRCQAAWGGQPLAGTEPVNIAAFNAGYALTQVRLAILGVDEKGGAVFKLAREIADWPRGAEIRLEIPSWEFPEPASRLHVTLLTAEFGAEE